MIGCVRFSGSYSQSSFDTRYEELKKKYERAFPLRTIQDWAYLDTGGYRSSLIPVWEPGKKLTVIYPKGVMNSLDVGSRVLFLCYSIEGLTTNIQWLVHMEQDFQYLDITLGFLLRHGSSGWKNPKLGQRRQRNREWVFYSLKHLVEMMLGQREMTDIYRRLIVALFLIQKYKLGLQGSDSKHHPERFKAAKALAFMVGTGKGRMSSMWDVGSDDSD